MEGYLTRGCLYSNRVSGREAGGVNGIPRESKGSLVERRGSQRAYGGEAEDLTGTLLEGGGSGVSTGYLGGEVRDRHDSTGYHVEKFGRSAGPLRRCESVGYQIGKLGDKKKCRGLLFCLLESILCIFQTAPHPPRWLIVVFTPY